MRLINSHNTTSVLILVWLPSLIEPPQITNKFVRKLAQTVQD